MTRLATISSVLLASAFVLNALGDVKVTASREYVDKKTTLSPVTNAGVVVGYKLGDQSGKNLITTTELGNKTRLDAVYEGGDTVGYQLEGQSGKILVSRAGVTNITKTVTDPIFANTNITFHIDGTDLIIKTNDVTVWQSPSQPFQAKRYALFLIHLNPNSSSHPFADIELKATVNNYYGDSMKFYCASSANGDPAKSGNPTWEHDWCRIYVLTSKVDTDVRRWKRIRNTTDLGTYNPRELAIIVDPSSQYLRRGQGSDWLSESNDELIWSYVRITASGPEMDEGNEKQLWRPTMPVKWYATLPSWANQTSY